MIPLHHQMAHLGDEEGLVYDEAAPTDIHLRPCRARATRSIAVAPAIIHPSTTACRPHEPAPPHPTRRARQSPGSTTSTAPFANGRTGASVARAGCACGLTSNPAIFEKAFAGAPMPHRRPLLGKPVTHIAETLIIEDIRAAADLFADLHRATGGGGGHVSLEGRPDPGRRRRRHGIEASRRLWQAVDRPT